MPTLTVTAKGQITPRRELLQHLGIGPGQQLTVDKLANGVLALHAKAPLGLEAFARCLPPPLESLTVDEMNALVSEGWAGRRRARLVETEDTADTRFLWHALGQRRGPRSRCCDSPHSRWP